MNKQLYNLNQRHVYFLEYIYSFISSQNQVVTSASMLQEILF